MKWRPKGEQKNGSARHSQRKEWKGLESEDGEGHAKKGVKLN